MLNPLTRHDIFWLFDDVWPRMERATSYRDNCLNQFEMIESMFRAYRNEPDILLQQLDDLSGIGLTISSGLIFSSNGDAFVPFDKYTMGWAIELRVVPDHKISQGNYTSYSEKIVDYIQGHKRLKSILDFVIEAENEARSPLSPA